MASGFDILLRMDDGETLHIGWRQQRAEAEELVQRLSEHWPGDYRIEPSEAEPSVA